MKWGNLEIQEIKGSSICFVIFMKISQNLCYRRWLEIINVSVVMNDVRCTEGDVNISDCSASFTSNNCSHRKDVWLQCKGCYRFLLNQI